MATRGSAVLGAAAFLVLLHVSVASLDMDQQSQQLAELNSAMNEASSTEELCGGKSCSKTSPMSVVGELVPHEKGKGLTLKGGALSVDKYDSDLASLKSKLKASRSDLNKIQAKIQNEKLKDKAASKALRDSVRRLRRRNRRLRGQIRNAKMTRGKRGPKGAKGATGARGYKGSRGRSGPHGYRGHRGKRGAPGSPGKAGSSGRPGTPGKPGRRGPGGFRGFRGKKGPKGARGVRGSTGSRGKRGVRGNPGPKGLKGKRGKRGKKGPRGPRGLRGTTGAVGMRGPKGLTGKNGKHGRKGLRGPRGLRGKKGPRGKRGAKGFKGYTGGRGIPGSRGSPGPRGNRGRRGNRGLRGSKGPRGGKGPHGSNGHNGRNGRNGKAGKAGKNGKPGKNGPRGSRGRPGRPGVKGPHGANGHTGRPGHRGPNGFRGFRGTRGGRGPRGPRGPRGYHGHRGRAIIHNINRHGWTHRARHQYNSLRSRIRMYKSLVRRYSRVRVVHHHRTVRHIRVVHHTRVGRRLNVRHVRMRRTKSKTILSGTVINFKTNRRVHHCKINIRKKGSKAIIKSVRSNGNGHWTATLAEGKYTVTAKHRAFLGVPIHVKLPKGRRRMAVAVGMSPLDKAMSGTGAVRFVLTWGNHPRDLDSHLVTPGGKCKVIYYHRHCHGRGIGDAVLDLDSTRGHGPETITIPHPVKGTYLYRVKQFSHDGNFRTSKAKVMVFTANRVRVFYAKKAAKGVRSNGIIRGKHWHVFRWKVNSRKIGHPERAR